jgi:serine/threonine-protein kinase PknG
MSTAIVRCAQPGCGGTVEDGYCNICGLAAPSGQASSGPVPSGPSGPVSSAPTPSGPASSGLLS